jgi:hypothetical protein
MFRIVCTRHAKDLLNEDAERNGLFAAISLDLFNGADGLDKTDTDKITYVFDLSKFSCPDNRVDVVVSIPTSSFEEYLEQLDEADCAHWYAVVDAETHLPYDETFERNIHPVWWGEQEGSR